jgi:hypothetical protein
MFVLAGIAVRECSIADGSTAALDHALGIERVSGRGPATERDPDVWCEDAGRSSEDRRCRVTTVGGIRRRRAAAAQRRGHRHRSRFALAVSLTARSLYRSRDGRGDDTEAGQVLCRRAAISIFRRASRDEQNIGFMAEPRAGEWHGGSRCLP